MAGRTRTTKKLAQRIDRAYFKKSFPIPHWRRVLSVVLTAIGLLWLGWSLVSGKQAFNAGPLAHAHKVVGNNCQSCHLQEATWGTKVSEKACETCHDGPAHQARETFTPECNSCHVEHQNSFKMAATSNNSCTQCHSDLKLKPGKPTTFATNIRSFEKGDGHPEFAAVRDGHPPDPATIKLNHFVHLKAGLKGPKGPVQMVCSDCHQELLPAPRDQAADVQTASLTTASSSTVTPQMAAMTIDPTFVPPAMNSKSKSLSPEMGPVNFERHCMSCHPLDFDARFKDPAPHKDSKIVQAYLIDQYTKYIALHPGEVHERVQLNPALPVRQAPPAPNNAGEWVAQRVEEADRLLFQKDCKECHDLTYPAPASLPDVPKANVATKWMRNAWFDHKAHLLVDCTQCHTEATKSQKTADVLLPKIATCQECHKEGKDSAVSECYECHVYHDWSKAKPIKNTSTISQVLR